MKAKQHCLCPSHQRPALLEIVAPALLLALICVLLVGTASASAAPNGASLVKDINDETVPANGNGDYGEFTEYGEELFFRAKGTQNGDQSGTELWKSDGTEDGTVLVKDIAVGSPFLGSIPTELTVSGSTLFFQANTGEAATGTELWKSDGTEDGTVLVKDINLLPTGQGGGTKSGNPLRLADANGTLFFLADDGLATPTGTADWDLWKSDGTESGTLKVHEFPEDVNSQLTGDLFPVGNKVYFSYDDGSGYELWVSDGITTEMVADINPGPGGSSPAEFFDFNGQLLFVADDGTSGRELWTSNGTAAGTALLENIRTDGEPTSSDPGELTLLPNDPGTADDQVLFSAANTGGNGNRRLFKTDGVSASPVEDSGPGTGGSPSDLTEYDGEIYYSAFDGPPLTTPGTHGRELWRSDGTDAGTALVKDINTVSGTPEYSNPGLLTVTDGLLYFNADDGINGSELWATDGTEERTVLVKDIYGGTDGSGDPNAGAPAFLTEAGDLLFFIASDGTHGRELWRAPKEIDPPTTAIESGPADDEIITVDSATFAFSSDEAESTFTCQLDSGASESCGTGSSASKTYSGLANGAHTFSVFATDAAGNADSSPATRSFTVAIPADPGDPGDPGNPGGPTTPGPTNPGPTNPGPTNPTNPTVPGDTSITDLDVTAKKKQKQKGKKIKIKISVSAQENITAKGSGKIKVKKPKKARYRLKPQTKKVEGGERTIIKLKPKSKKDARKIKKAIKKWKKASRKRKKKLAVKAPVKVVATDDAGNKQAEKRVVTLK